MLADFGVDLMTADFKSSDGRTTHMAFGFRCFVFNRGCEPLDASSTKRVVAICDDYLVGRDLVKAERTFAIGRVFIDGEFLHKRQLLQIGRGSLCDRNGSRRRSVGVTQGPPKLAVLE